MLYFLPQQLTLEYLSANLLDAPGLLLYDPSLGFVAPSLEVVV